MLKQYINPPVLFNSLQYGFSQVVACRGGTTLYLSGQVAWDENEQIVGAGDLALQTEQALRNVETAVKSAGGTRTDIATMRIYVVDSYLEQGAIISNALTAFFASGHAPATSWIGVSRLANTDFLIEIEAVAVIE